MERDSGRQDRGDIASKRLEGLEVQTTVLVTLSIVGYVSASNDLKVCGQERRNVCTQRSVTKATSITHGEDRENGSTPSCQGKERIDVSTIISTIL